MLKTFFRRAGSLHYAPVCNFSASFQAKDIEVIKTKNPITKPPLDISLKFGETNTDHMLEILWTRNEGWKNPQILPFHDFAVNPFNSTIHYALSCFEGMKAYKAADGSARLFRPERNVARFQDSFKRLAFPDFNEDELLECIKQLIRVEKDWVPDKMGYSLYLRPTGMSMTNKLGVRPPEQVLLYVCCSPVGPYYPTGFKAIKLFVDSRHIRAAYGGSGNYKIASNYGPSIKVSMDAEKRGYSQILWITDGYITEVGTSNFMVRWINEMGEDEVVTAPLDGLILPGVTRDSILTLLRMKGDLKVTERRFTLHEVLKAVTEKRLIEAFGCGTAAVISPVRVIHYEGIDYNIPIKEEYGAGELSKQLNEELMAIQYGKIEHKWSIKVE